MQCGVIDRQTTDRTAGYPMLRQYPPPQLRQGGGGIKHARNGLLVCITMRTVVLLDILCKIVQKLGFIMHLAIRYPPDIHCRGPNDVKSTVILNTNHANSYLKMVSRAILV